MDSINQLAKTINKIKGTADYAANKRYRPKRVERATDTFDLKVPFTMDFLAKPEDNTTLSLYFKTPAPSLCCGTCYCSVCENFSNNLTITLTYGYISGTLNVFVDNLKVTDFEEIDPDAGTLRLNTTGENIRVCYIYYAGGCGPLEEPVPSCTDVDNFDRVSVGSWSPGPLGTWSVSVTSGSYGIDGTVGNLNTDFFSDALAKIDGTGPWSTGFEMTMKFTLTDNNSWFSPDFFVGVVAVGHFNANINLFKGGAGTMAVFGANSTASAVPGLVDGTTYYLKWDFHNTDSHVRAKIWADGDSEPSWQVDFDDGTVPFAPDRFYISVHASSTEVDLQVDSISFCP